MPNANRSALLAAVSLLGAALGVTTAQADPPSAHSSQSKASDQHKTSNQVKLSNQLKSGTQIKTIDTKSSNQIKVSNQLKQHGGAASSH